MAVGFESRSPKPDDIVTLGIIDTHNSDAWTDLGTTSAWCWQQGCMLQWIPGRKGSVIWNERNGDRFLSRIYDTHAGTSHVLPDAIYTVAPNGRTAIGTDFRRINDMRPGYGYVGIADPNQKLLAPDDSGIYTIDLDTGTSHQIISIAEVANLPYRHGDLSQAKHYFNHLLFNTDGSRFIFLHRWRFENSGFQTRMLTAAADGRDLHVVDDYGHMSHFIWRDTETILAWSWQPAQGYAFYLYKDLSPQVEIVGESDMTANGHCTYLANSNWILNDSYPQSEKRTQELYVYHVPTERRIELGNFHSPEEYTGEWRCDLHPRSNTNGYQLTIDSAHAGNGRQIYLIDIENLVSTT